ncbi:SDR family NAD(P)-dependent oxidoreductase [Salinispora arenicola]|uniref:Short-chain dehydrogenase/reductase n=1 Tax=Salinispora arenicola TaxID=168697 RepID=A0A542XNY7_SALAC|nr:SDR family NAD(P)-dependent oxidoreductase [Salinispora arenicola]MCN0151844.1 SDR family NAD(P)-dependent oxidoreductase [Salinispora arenicola]TQL37545.1 short-subunit dehydrogenase [Salinispora arenicola]GIM87136.1 short-chain dehydrogenase/reductase [Salinispora arenicola]
MSTSSGPVLITGCSSGIGLATATRLIERGYPVYATARRAETLEALERRGAVVLGLDVTDEDSARVAVKRVEADHGRVGTLINNAGYGEYGPVETVPLAAARAQFETNLFGLARMCQLVLPGMRAAGTGRIVNVSSVGGRITFPGGGFYNASKFAVESLSDALRFEVEPFGISVVVVEPNLIRHTRFDAHVAESLQRNAPEDSPYRHLRRAMLDQLRMCFETDSMSVTPETVAATIERVLGEARPRTRYVVSRNGRFLVRLRWALSDRAFDRALRKQFGLDDAGVYNGRYARAEPGGPNSGRNG